VLMNNYSIYMYKSVIIYWSIFFI